MTFIFDDRDPTELFKRATDDSVWESNDGNVIVYIGRFGWNADYQQFNHTNNTYNFTKVEGDFDTKEAAAAAAGAAWDEVWS